MKNVHRLVAFASGFALYSAVVFFGGVLAALPVPRAYFAWFGSHRALALVLEEAVLVALPIVLLALAWSFLTIRPFRGAWRHATTWCLGGLALAWLVWLVHGFAEHAANLLPGPLPVGTLLLFYLLPPVWGILNLLAAPCGVLVGGSLAREA